MGAGDAALVTAARLGDRAAFGRLVDRHRSMLMRLVHRLLEEPGDAEDVAQEACLQAYLALDRLRSPERFGAWLAGIGLNLARQWLRQRSALHVPEDWVGGRVPTGLDWAEALRGPSAEALAEARELQVTVLAAVAALPTEQQAAVRLFYWEGLTVSEVGSATGAPPGTVKARLHRARQRLRGTLADVIDASPRGQEQEARMIEVIVQEVVLAGQKDQDVVEAAGPAPQAGAEPVRLPLPPGLGRGRVVLLKEREGERILPIWVGPFEGDSIAMLRAGATTTRPMTFELMARLMEVGQVAVERVVINKLSDDVYYAALAVRAGGAAREVDARPSDAVALALRLGVPIFVDAAVLDQTGVMPDNLTEPLGRGWERVDGHAVFQPKPKTA
jgi:RNA polymerase sigma factor (sigma-70 family)